MRLWDRRTAVVAAAVIVVAIVGFTVGDRYAEATLEEEADRLMQVLDLRPGMKVAEIGAGDGSLALLLAERLGPHGHIWVTEIVRKKLEAIGHKVREAGLKNVTVLMSAEAETNLPPECCDAILMRKVYHHFEDALAMDRSLLVSLKAGGRLGVIDFPPRGWRRFLPGAEEERSGHGVEVATLIAELEQAGFKIQDRIDEWYSDHYCVVAVKRR